MATSNFKGTMNGDGTMPPKPQPLNRHLHMGDEILGRYVVRGELGQGGMGVVYRCLDKIGGVEVAVKCLPPEVSRNSSEMEDVRRNYQIVQGLVHDNIAVLKTLDWDDAGDYYVVMELANGINLKKWAECHAGVEKIDEKIAILRQIANALDYAHSAKPKYVIHRDIKPENIMVDAEEHVKVLDFGLAAQVQSSVSRVSMLVTSRSGTAAYKSPEQWKAQAQKASADQYSLGAVAYYLFAGNPPFDSDDIGILKDAVLHDPIPAIDGLPKHVFLALRKVLAKDPNDRFDNCGEFVDALEGKLAFRRTILQSNKLIMAAGALLAGVLAIGGIVLCRLNQQTDGTRQPVPIEDTSVSPGNLVVDRPKTIAGAVSAGDPDPEKIKAEAFSCGADVERASSMIAAEPEEVRQAFSEEIRRFEQDRTAGRDAKNGTPPDYKLAVTFFTHALHKAKDLKGKVDSYKEEHSGEGSSQATSAKSATDETTAEQSDETDVADATPSNQDLSESEKTDAAKAWQVRPARCQLCGGMGFREIGCQCRECYAVPNGWGGAMHGKICPCCHNQNPTWCLTCGGMGYLRCSRCGGTAKERVKCSCNTPQTTGEGMLDNQFQNLRTSAQQQLDVRQPATQTLNVWVEGKYVDQIQDGVMVRIWQPGHYERRRVVAENGEDADD